jgi:anaphase-promoting complex subunit 11
MKRSSETPVLPKPSSPVAAAPDPSASALAQKAASHPPSRLKVTIKKFHGVSHWTWGCADDDVCGICQSPFEGCAPGIKFPGDECPVVWGRCKHAYHLQCISTWLGSGKSTCPICRAEWEFSDRDVA